MMLCLTDALPAGGYQHLLERAGFATLNREDLSAEVLGLLAELRSKLALANGTVGPAPELAVDLYDAAPSLLDGVEELVASGKIGYWLYVALNPD
jgi:hypothetical protein